MRSDHANVVTAEIVTPDNPSDQVWRKSERSGCTYTNLSICRGMTQQFKWAYLLYAVSLVMRMKHQHSTPVHVRCTLRTCAVCTVQRIIPPAACWARVPTCRRMRWAEGRRGARPTGRPPPTCGTGRAPPSASPQSGGSRHIIACVTVHWALIFLKVVCRLQTNSHYIFPRIGSHGFHLWTQSKCCPDLK